MYRKQYYTDPRWSGYSLPVVFVDLGNLLDVEQPANVISDTRKPGVISYQITSKDTIFLSQQTTGKTGDLIAAVESELL
jgi:hypothetical protein